MKVYLTRLASRMGLAMFAVAGAILLLTPSAGFAQAAGSSTDRPVPTKAGTPPGRPAATGAVAQTGNPVPTKAGTPPDRPAATGAVAPTGNPAPTQGGTPPVRPVPTQAVPAASCPIPTDVDPATGRPALTHAALATERPVPTGMVKLPTAPAVFPQEALQIATHPPIKFVPFAMLDPQTRLPIAPDAIIRLPNGKQGTAKAYYDQLNQYEQWLNEHGQTVRQPEQHAVIEFETMPVDTQLMQRQINASPKPTSIPVQANLLQTHSFKTLSSPVILHIDPSGLSELHLRPLAAPAELNAMTAKVNASCLRGTVVNHFVVNPPALAAIATLLPNPANMKVDCTLINKSQNWNWDIGDPAKFNAYVNGTMALNGQACRPPNLANYFAGNQSKFALTAEAHAGGYLYHIGGDVLRLTGSAGGDASNNTVNASFGAFVLGQNIYSVNQTANTYWGLDKTISKSVDFSSSTIIPLGPINLALTIGAQGSAGVDFSLDLYATHLVGTVSPFVNSSVYAQAGVNLLVAEAGVGFNMVLENANLNLSESAGIGWFYGYYFASDLYADANLNMLGGNVYAYVKYSYPCTDWSQGFWCTTQDNANLYSWGGLHYNSVLFNDQSGMYLNW